MRVWLFVELPTCLSSHPRLFELLQHLAELVQKDVHVALLEDQCRPEADADLATASGENT